MATDNSRGLKDALLSATTALPNAGNTVNTSGIDLGSATPYPVTENFTAKISTAAATGANNKNITLVFQDSADNSTFANVAGLGTLVVTDDNGGGYPAGSLEVSLPPGTRRYLRASATGEANGGNAADANVTVELLF